MSFLHYWKCAICYYRFVVICTFVALSSCAVPNRTSSKTNTSVERSVSVSFDNTKIYFFGDKIEFAGEVHNRYPDGGAGGSGGPQVSGISPVETINKDGHVLRNWGTPEAPGLLPTRPMPRVHYIDAECQNDYMKITILFNGSFNGMIYSSKYAYNPDCLYVNGTGSQRYEFYIRLNRCGTLGGGPKGRGDDNDKKMMWNTLTIQYNPLIEEEWDQHFRVTCEYGYQFWKKVSFPVLDVKVPTESPLLFSLSPPECQMEIRSGFNLEGVRVGGPVNVGDPLTLVIYMRSPTVGFDIIINNCHAHNGASKRMSLIDEHGCPVESKIISDFKGVDVHRGVYESKVYAYFKAFRFTGSPALYIECDVRMCHGICPKQRCYWRNLRGHDDSAPDGRHSNSTKDPSDTFTDRVTDTDDQIDNRTYKVAPLFNDTDKLPSPTAPTKRSSTGIPSTTVAPTTPANNRWLTTSSTPAVTSSGSVTPTITRTTIKKTSSTVSSMTTTVTGNKMAKGTTTAPPTTSVKAKQRNSPGPSRADLVSTVSLTIPSRRIKRAAAPSGGKKNNTISETVNLFQSLEVRSERAPEPEDFAKASGSTGSLLCIRSVGFTAIISVLLLLVILVTSISCILCARLRRLQGLDDRKAPSDELYANRKLFAASISQVHRTT